MIDPALRDQRYYTTSQMPLASPTGWLDFFSVLHGIFGPQHGPCFLPRFWSLEVWGCAKNFRKFVLNFTNPLGSCDRASWAKCEERSPTRCNNWMFIINFCLNMFRALLCPSSGEQRLCYCIWCVVLVLLDVVGSGCGALSCTKCSNRAFVLLKMGIMMPESCWDRS